MSLTIGLRAADGSTSLLVLPSPVVSGALPTPAPTGFASTVGTIVSPLPAGMLSVQITPSGGSMVQYDEASAVAGDDWTDANGAFVMHHKVAPVNAAIPYLYVFFRPDADGSRAEIVFEYGDPLAASGVPVNLGAYAVTILKGGQTLWTGNVPAHYWNSRWRWQSVARPIVASLIDLTAKKLLPQFDGTLGAFTIATKSFTYDPMGLAGLTALMGTTGERDDIGLVTNWQADYIINNRNAGTVWAQGEAGGTWQWIWRDRTTGAPLDIDTYPNASSYGNGSPNIYTPAVAGLSADPGHEPALTYLLWLLTNDPYYLEQLHFQCNYDVLSLPPAAHFVSPSQTRAFAWTLRNIAQAAAVTPSAVPRWMKPQSYWQSMLDRWHTYATGQAASGSSLLQPFGSIDPGFDFFFDFWMNAFVAAAMTLTVRLGHTEWLPEATWATGEAIGITSATSGWMRAHCGLYNVPVRSGATSPNMLGATETTVTVGPLVGRMSPTPLPFAGVPAIPFTAYWSDHNEQVIVTDRASVSGTVNETWTITRGANGTVAAGHGANQSLYTAPAATWSELLTLALAMEPSALPTMPGDPTGMNVLYSGKGGWYTYPSYVRGALAIARDLSITDAGTSFTWLDGQIRTQGTATKASPDWKWCIA